MNEPTEPSSDGDPRKWLVLASMCFGLGMLMIDTFVVNVALPSISRDFQADLSRTQWVVSAYVLAVAVLPVSTGRVGDIFGRRRVYLIGLALFILTSALAALAPNIETLIVVRALQGVGGAVMMPGTLSIITQAFPARQRGLAIGIWGGVSGLGLIAGPLLGGLLVNSGSWRLIFIVNLPVGALAILAAWLFVTESRDETARRSLDWPGLATLSSGLLLVMLALTRGDSAGWVSAQTLASAIGGFALLVLFVQLERRASAPLIDLSLFRSGTFVAASLSAFLFSAAVFGSQPYVSLFMQNFWEFTPLQGGLAFIPATVLVALLMPLSGIIGQRLGPRLRLLLILASALVVVSGVVLLNIQADDGYVRGLLPSFVLRGLGIGLFMSASSFAVVSSVPLAKSGLASGTLAMSRNIGTAVGVALLGAVHLRHVRTTIEGAAAPGSDLEPAITAAGNFVVDGPSELLAIAEDAIVVGFVQIALATVALSLIAGIASSRIRLLPRPPATAPTNTTSTPEPARAAIR